jgi:hypothetical protein
LPLPAAARVDELVVRAGLQASVVQGALDARHVDGRLGLSADFLAFELRQRGDAVRRHDDDVVNV